MDLSDPSLLHIRETPHGVVLPILAKPGSRRNAIVGIHNGRLKVAVTQVPEKGKANQELQKLLARTLDVSRSDVELQQGESTPLKEFHIAGLSADKLRARLQTAIAEG